MRVLSQWWIRTLGWCSQSSDSFLPKSRDLCDTQVCHTLYEPVLWLLELPGCLGLRCCSWRKEAKEGVMAYGHLFCSQEQPAAGSHPCALAFYCSASPCASQSPTWHRAWIPRIQFSPGVSKGMWTMGQGLLNVAVSRGTLRELRVWRCNRASQPWDPESLKHVCDTAIADCRASMKEAISFWPTDLCATEVLQRKENTLSSCQPQQ